MNGRTSLKFLADMLDTTFCNDDYPKTDVYDSIVSASRVELYSIITIDHKS